MTTALRLAASPLILSLVLARSAEPSPLPGRQLQSSLADSVEHPTPAPLLGRLQPVLGAFHFVMLQRASGDSVYHHLGDVTVNREAASIGGVPMLRNIASYDWGNGRHTIDTTISLAGTLAPVSERTRTPSRIVAYDFAGLHSRGRIGPVDSLKPIDDLLPQASFNSTDLDMLVTSLPLDARFHATIPLYDPEFPGFRMAELRVNGTVPDSASGHGQPAWLLSLDEIHRPTMYFRVDPKTHRVLQKDFGTTGGPQFRIRTTDPV